jgi:membrane-associated protein
LILLTGLNFPLSEDLLILSGGAICSTCMHENLEIAKFYAWIYFACWFAAWETYWVGRLLGPKLFNFRLFRNFITPQRLEKIKKYIHRFGIFTFIVGRCIPGGRNALFMSTGLIKMSFPLFIMRDSVGCVLSTATVFSLGYLFGSHFHEIVEIVKFYEMFFISAIAFIILLIVGIVFLRKSINSKKGKPHADIT